MGTPHNTDGRLSRYRDLSETITIELIQILKENYLADKLSLGNNLTDNFREKEVFYTLVDSEFENVFLTFKYKNTEFESPYEIILEERGNDSTSELKISPDEDLVNQLPEKMISELSDRFYDFIRE
ncbi:hypothetical protein SAMN05444411_1294 [Lutibacter oricola]|uniref:Uncharacterized protein n=1 Tax=Lutibacter oricola TaxID=762486 RepID=A0A1H3HAL1_9FLAO|nr:hypothetical protein [Lutibacter oricola]SDY11824.1 hypothetical protein SAMN05444411_1294 [Lutibacter oricola]